jgi:tRNA(adenine34) deaminase
MGRTSAKLSRRPPRRRAKSESNSKTKLRLFNRTAAKGAVKPASKVAAEQYLQLQPSQRWSVPINPNLTATDLILTLAGRAMDRFLSNPALHEKYMRLALREAQTALAEDEVPIGAVIVHEPPSGSESRTIAAAHNQREQLRDPTAHAEMIAITQAAEALGDWRLEHCTLYVTLEPCAMCAGAIVLARLPRVVYGAIDPKAGAVTTLYELLGDPRLNHRAEVIAGVLAEPCGEVLSRFFAQKRREGKK